MDDAARRKVARQELVGLLLSAMEQAHDLSTRRLPNTGRAITRHYLKLERQAENIGSLATALRILETQTIAS
jgi:hypothetical protein